MARPMLIGLLVLMAAQAMPLESLRPVRLRIYDGVYVKLLAGNPGRYLNFRLNYTLDEIQLHTSLAVLSQTHTELPESELFYLEDYCLRLPFTYARDSGEPIALLASPGPYSGTLGLGRYSPLWKYWRRATFSTRSMLLGGYDSYAQLEYSERPPMLTHGRVKCTLDTGYVAELRLAPGQLDTYLPGESFTEQPHEIQIQGESDCEADYSQLGIEGECSNTFTLAMRPQTLLLNNQQPYTATKRSHDGTLSLGKRFFDDYAFFCDWDFDKSALSSSSFSFREANFNAVCAIMLILLLSIWLVFVLSEVQEEWLFQIVLFLEVYAYLVVAVSLFVNFYAMHWSRFLSNFLETHPLPVTVFSVYIIASSVTLAIMLLVRSVRLPLHLNEPSAARHQRNMWKLRYHNDFRIFLFLTVTLVGLWLCVLPNHQSGTDLVYLLFFSTMLCIAAGVLTLHNLWSHKPHSIIMAVHTVLLYWFLIYANIIPATDILDIHDDCIFTVVLFMSALVFLPTELIFGKIVLTEYKHTKEWTKGK